MTRTLKNPILQLAIFCISTQTCQAMVVLDQSVNATRNGGITVADGKLIGQTFIAGRNGLLSQVGIQLRKSSATEDATLLIYNASNNEPTTSLGSVAIPVSSIGFGGLVPFPYVDLDVSSLGINVTAEQELAIVITYDGNGSYFWPDAPATPADVYPDGRSVLLTEQHGWLPVLIPRDYGFRTFVELVPEPSTLILALTGLPLTLRRKKSSSYPGPTV